jgi:hypothetical protein
VLHDDAGDAVPTVGPDRALIDHLTEEAAILHVGPGGTEVHVPVEALPEGAEAGTWVVLDVQVQPPMIVGIDDELTRQTKT